MAMLNDIDRYRLVMDVIDRVPGLADRASEVLGHMAERRQEARDHTRAYGEDPAYIQDWTWPA
jgi:xylulose-5-phosphate/fructose-6-phosphate phosphoketolase